MYNTELFSVVWVDMVSGDWVVYHSSIPYKDIQHWVGTNMMGWLFSAGSSSTLLNCCNNPAMLYELRLCNNDNDVTTALSTCLHVHVTIAIITKDYVHVHVYVR